MTPPFPSTPLTFRTSDCNKISPSVFAAWFTTAEAAPAWAVARPLLEHLWATKKESSAHDDVVDPGEISSTAIALATDAFKSFQQLRRRYFVRCGRGGEKGSGMTKGRDHLFAKSIS